MNAQFSYQQTSRRSHNACSMQCDWPTTTGLVCEAPAQLSYS